MVRVGCHGGSYLGQELLPCSVCWELYTTRAWQVQRACLLYFFWHQARVSEVWKPLWRLLFDPTSRAIRETLCDVGGHASAFADDVGLALPEVVHGLRQLVILLDWVGAASGLHLNWTKMVLLSCSKFSDFQVRRKLKQSAPRASGILIQSSGKYLGYLVGPSAATKVWDKPSSKFLRRARHVRGLGLSLFETSVTFGIFAFSVLRITLRLMSVSTTFTSTYGIALDIVTGTPRYAYGASILCHLQTPGFPPNSDFPNLPPCFPSHCLPHRDSQPCPLALV